MKLVWVIGQVQKDFLCLHTLFWVWTEVHKVLVMHKVLVTQAPPGTVCHLLDVVRGILKPGKLCKISETKIFPFSKLQTIKKFLFPKTKYQIMVNTKQDKIKLSKTSATNFRIL